MEPLRPSSPQLNTEPVFCRAEEAAAAIPMKLRTFLFYLEKGMIPSYKFGRNRFFKKAEVIAAIERHRIGTVDEVL